MEMGTIRRIDLRERESTPSATLRGRERFQTFPRCPIPRFLVLPVQVFDDSHSQSLGSVIPAIVPRRACRHGPMTAAWPKTEGNEIFSQTQWTWVLRATHGSAGESVEAWESLARQYWKPLYVFCRKKGDPPETAKDHVQGFFHELLSQRRLTGIDPAGGKLRNWLMTAMVQHRSRVWRATQAQKRLPVGGFDPRELSEIDQTLRIEGKGSAEDAFRRQWAQELLEQAYQEMRSRYAARGQEARFLSFWPRMIPGARPEEHHSLANSLRMTPGALATALWQFRQEYQRILRKAVRATLDEGDDVDAELRELIRAISGA